MKVMYNRVHGVLFYPENKIDILKVAIIKLVLPSFKRTWNIEFKNYIKPQVHTIESKVEETDYPDMTCAG